MNSNNYDNTDKSHINSEDLPEDFSLDDILAEFAPDTPARYKNGAGTAGRSKRIVMDAIEETVSEASISSLDEFLEIATEETRAELEPEPEPESELEDIVADALSFSGGDTGFSNAEETEPEPQAEMFEAQVKDTDKQASYAKAGIDGKYEDEPHKARPKNTKRAPGKERFLTPIMAFLALSAIKKEQRRKADVHQSATIDEEKIPEMVPEKAAKLYAAQMQSIKLRAIVAGALCLVMAYFAFAYNSSMPLLGAFKGNIRTVAMMMVLLELTVIICTLDVFASGFMGLKKGRIGLESIAFISCVLTIIDAAIIAIAGKASYGLPFCTISAFSMTFIQIGSYFTCKGYRTSFKVLSSRSSFYTITAERAVDDKSTALLKSAMDTGGFIRRSERPDVSEYMHLTFAPFFLIAALVFAMAASLFHGEAKSFFHCLSAMVAVGATFSASVCFALPFSVCAKRLSRGGSALAGWAAVRDIGKSRHVVITDSDIFPSGTVQISSIRVLEGFFSDRVIAYSGSIAIESASGLSQAFAELMKKNGYPVYRTEHFEVHDGGGMTAMIEGDNVIAGSNGFMNLMGIRIPRKLSTPSSFFTAVNGQLVGIFEIGYKPVSSVQGALAMLLRSDNKPVFAIRDFNITPVMIKEKFKLPTDKFEFPSFSERYRISSHEPGEESQLDAVVSREGMAPLAEVSDRGRRLYTTSVIGAVISAVCAVIGLVLLTLLFWVKAYDSASVTNILTYMLLWFLPSIVLTWTLSR